MSGRIRGAALIALITALSLLTGCSGEAATPTAEPAVSAATETPAATASAETSDEPKVESSEIPMEMTPPTVTPAAYIMPMPEASGTEEIGNEKTSIDVSNKKDGYIMVKFLEATDKKLVIQITGPSGTVYQYILNNSGEYDVFPLSDGNGSYQVGVYQNVSGGNYSTACTASLEVELADEFAPFLRPNQYVNYTENSKAVKKAAELTAGIAGTLDKIGAIYNYVVENISYDKELAQRITEGSVTGYVPDVDAVLESGKGICFDYAVLTAAMLRSLGIPTRLVSGYAGSVPHAWISVYSEQTGQLDDVISFDGVSWVLMDPTFASSGNQSEDVMQYIGNGDNYTAIYLY